MDLLGLDGIPNSQKNVVRKLIVVCGCFLKVLFFFQKKMLGICFDIFSSNKNCNYFGFHDYNSDVKCFFCKKIQFHF